MNFFEGRIYKPQGKDLTGVVSSRVPVVLGSLAVQNGTLYYCKSCTYNTSTKLYSLIWAEVVVNVGGSTVYSRVSTQQHVDTIIEAAPIKSTEISSYELVCMSEIDFRADTIVPKYPTEGSILANIMGTTDVTIEDALQYASMSELKIDGYFNKRHFYPSHVPWVSNAEKEYYYLHKSMYHEILPPRIDDANGRSVYSPVFGASQIITKFSSATTASPSVMIFGNAATLIGAHFVFTYRTFYYAAVIDSIGDNNIIVVRDEHSGNGHDEGFSIESIRVVSINNPNGAVYANNEADTNPQSVDNIKMAQLSITVSCTERSLVGDKYAFYLKLDASFAKK